MGSKSIYFGGREILVPGVYTVADDSAMTPERGTPTRRVAVIATAQGGEVGKVTTIRAFSEIKRKLVGGVGAQLCELVMAPSGEVQGANEIDFYRVNVAVAATSAAGGAGTYTAKAPGKVGNAVRFRQTANATRGTDVTVEDTVRGLKSTFLALGPVIEITLAAASVTPSVSVADAGGTKTLTLVNNAITNTFNGDNYPSVESLVAAINDTTQWTARLVSAVSGALTNDILAQAYTLTASKTDLTIGGKALEYALADSEIATFVTSGAAFTVANDYKFLSGGTEGPAVVLADFTNALALAEESDVVAVVVGSGITGVQAAAKAHCQTMSDAKNRRERVAYVGVETQASKSALKSALLALSPLVGAQEVVIGGAEPRLLDAATNKLTTYPTYYYAAMLAGMKAGNVPEMSPTNKAISVSGLSYVWTVTDLEDLLNAGIAPAHFDADKNAYVVTQALTGYTADANVSRRKLVGVDIKHFLNKKIRIRTKRFIGGIGDQATVQQILNAAAAVLNEETRKNGSRGVLTPGVNPATGAPEPAWKNLEVVMDGFDLVAVRFECHPVGEIAYITGTAFLTPVKIVARA